MSIKLEVRDCTFISGEKFGFFANDNRIDQETYVALGGVLPKDKTIGERIAETYISSNGSALLCNAALARERIVRIVADMIDLGVEDFKRTISLWEPGITIAMNNGEWHKAWVAWKDAFRLPRYLNSSFPGKTGPVMPSELAGYLVELLGFYGVRHLDQWPPKG